MAGGTPGTLVGWPGLTWPITWLAQAADAGSSFGQHG
jgi:hypothetical protein